VAVTQRELCDAVKECRNAVPIESVRWGCRSVQKYDLVGRGWWGGTEERAMVLVVVLAIMRGNCGVNSSNR
jgi:hypothetical protein